MTRSSANLEAELVRSWPAAEWRDVHVVLAVSGGADSVAMLRAMLAAKRQAGGAGQLSVAHLHHGLRGEAADEDANWLADLCRRLELPLERGRADVAAAAARQGDGWEAAAREARYTFLRQTAERFGARFIATAHTADDQVETVLHNLIRGTGLSGLAGMPRSRSLSPTVSLIRPLLAVRRADVLAYLAGIGQDFREDATNTDRRFTRNRLRHELLPVVRAEFNADFHGALLRLAQQAGESQIVISELAERLAEQCVERSQNGLRIDTRRLAGRPPLLVREVCKTAWAKANWPRQDMGFDQWQQLADRVLSGSASAAAVFPGGIRVRREGHSLVLER